MSTPSATSLAAGRNTGVVSGPLVAPWVVVGSGQVENWLRIHGRGRPNGAITRPSIGTVPFGRDKVRGERRLLRGEGRNRSLREERFPSGEKGLNLTTSVMAEDAEDVESAMGS
jgi:hypothetical protein